MKLSDRTRRWLPWMLLAVAVIATGAVYWPGVTGGWVFDDYPNIVDNAALHLTTFPTSLGTWITIALSSPASFLHRPLASITFALNWLQGGGNPYPFKVTNILIHLLNGVLVFCMLRALFRLMRLRGDVAHSGPSPALRAPSPEGRGERRDDIPPTRSVDPHPAEGGEFRRGDIPLTRGVDVPPTEERKPESSDTADAARTEPSPALRAPSPGGRGKRRGDIQPTQGDGSRWHMDDATATRLALLIAAAWMLSPINLMAVLYVVQRMESLCQVFVLAGLWAYLHGRWMMLTANGDTRRDARGFSLAVGGIVLGTVIGVTSKETAVLLPVFAFLAEAVLMRFRRDLAGVPIGASDTVSVGGEASLPPSERKGAGATGSTDKRIWGLFIVTLFVPGALGFVWLLRSALRASSWAGRTFTLGQRLLTEARVLVDYLHWTLLPNPDVLSLYHDEIVKSTGLLTPWTTLGSIVLLAALIVVAVLLRNRRPLVALGIGWFFAGNLLTATIIPLELVYEQRMYFPTIGVLLAAGALLIGRRWKIPHALPRVFVAAIALLWFGTATNLRAQEWSNPIRLAVAEAGRHPESPRAVYEAGRLLLIASDYREGAMLTASRKYLQQAADIPGSSALPDQALIMIADHHHHGDDARLWQGMIAKLGRQPTKQEDISALISLTNCYGAGICKFDPQNLQHAYLAALSRPDPISRLDGAYADFQRDILHNDVLATKYLALAVKGDPGEPAYRVDLSALYARQGETEKALEQIDALERMNYAGRLTKQIDVLRRLAEQGKVPAPTASQ